DAGSGRKYGVDRPPRIVTVRHPTALDAGRYAHRTRFPLSARLAYCSAPPLARSPVTGLERAMPTMAPRRVSAMTLLAISALPAPGTTDTAMPISALRTTLPVTATSRR